jgi:hypothetical protein
MIAFSWNNRALDRGLRAKHLPAMDQDDFTTNTSVDDDYVERLMVELLRLRPGETTAKSNGELASLGEDGMERDANIMSVAMQGGCRARINSAMLIEPLLWPISQTGLPKRSS